MPATVTGTPKFKVPTFDGATSWTAFRQQFEVVAKANGWEDEYAMTALTLSLRGEALLILENLPSDGRNLESLLKALEARYGDKHLEHVYRAQLKERTQRAGEGLQQWATEAERLVRRAYASSAMCVDEIIVQTFVDGIRDNEVRAAVRLGHHKRLETALAHALEVEVVRRDHKAHSVREIAANVKHRGGPMCYACGERGHIRLDCPAQKRSCVVRRPVLERCATPCPTLQVSQACDGNSLITSGRINDKPARLTIDTGASKTIVRPELLKRTILRDSQRPAIRLQTATGQPVTVLGVTDITIKLGDRTYYQRCLVASITDDCIIGLDFLRSQQCVVNVAKGVLSFPDQEVFLEGSSPSAVYNAKAVILAPKTETLVDVRFPEGVTPDRCVVVEDTGRHPSVITARSLIMTRRGAKVKMMNLSNATVKLPKNAIIGRCDTVEYIRKTEAFEQKTSSPKHMDAVLAATKEALTPSEYRAAEKLLLEYRDIFTTGDNDLGRTGLVKHAIDTGDTSPIKQRPRRIPLAKEQEVTDLIQDMASNKIIEPSTSPWSSPVVLVKKKDGSTRFCVDYRMLNNVTKKDSYPLPRIDDTLDMLGGMKWFSTIDLKSGYWQVELRPEDKEKTAFTTGTGKGLWQFRVMPFGLCNAPATFERLMERVLVGLLGDSCLVYLDDVIVMGRSFSEHQKNLEKVFRRFRESNLKLNPKKCAFFKKQVSFLGHIISDKGVQTDPDKIKAVKDWPEPKSKTDVRAFLGLCAYYRRFVKNFSEVAKPLHRLTEDKRTFIWDADCRQSFTRLKDLLCSTPILGYPNRTGRFIVDTDASNTGIGGVLSQEQNGQQVVIAYFSKTLSKPERNYCVTRRELLAVVKTLQHFSKYLLGRQFTLRTDHAALKWLLQFKNPEGQVARWIEQLQEYDFVIEHRSGRSHANADALSRRPCGEDCKHCSKHESKEEVKIIRTHELDETWRKEEIRKAQSEDKDLGPIMDWKSKEQKPLWSDISAQSPVTKAYWAQWDSLILQEGVLYRRWESINGKEQTLQLVIPKSRVPAVLKLVHDGTSGGHLGVKRTLTKIRERFYWVRCRDDVEDWCRKCSTCASVKGPRTRSRGKLQIYNVGAPWERIAIDVAGPFPPTEDGNRYIVVVQDYFTKWPEVFATPNQEAQTVAKKLIQEVVCRFGVPLELHSDQGRNFESALFQEMCKLLGIHKTRTTPAHPQSDGMVERFNQTLGNHLAKVVEEHQRDWDQYIPLFLMSYRSAIHETTGFTPANVNFGREIRLPVDLLTGTPPDTPKPAVEYVAELQRRLEETHELVRANNLKSSERMKTRYDRKANVQGFEEGSLVWLHNPLRRIGKSPKLQARWEGPYKIITKINDVTYRIRQGDRKKPKIVHIDRLAPYHGTNDARDEHD